MGLVGAEMEIGTMDRGFRFLFVLAAICANMAWWACFSRSLELRTPWAWRKCRKGDAWDM